MLCSNYAVYVDISDTRYTLSTKVEKPRSKCPDVDVKVEYKLDALKTKIGKQKCISVTKKRDLINRLLSRARRALSIKNAKLDTVETGDYRAVNIDVPEVQKKNVTEIATKHFLIKIIMGDRKEQLVPEIGVRKIKNISNKIVVVFDKPIERYDQGVSVMEENTASATEKNIEDEDRKLIKEAIMGEIISKITKGKGNQQLLKDISERNKEKVFDQDQSSKCQVMDDNFEGCQNQTSNVPNNGSSQNQANNFPNKGNTTNKDNSKNKQLTDMFVSFVTQLSSRLNLNNIKIAEKILSHVNNDKNMPGNNTVSGTGRDKIPLIGNQYVQIIEDLKYYVNDEVNSATVVGTE